MSEEDEAAELEEEKEGAATAKQAKHQPKQPSKVGRCFQLAFLRTYTKTDTHMYVHTYIHVFKVQKLPGFMLLEAIMSYNQSLQTPFSLRTLLYVHAQYTHTYPSNSAA